MKVIVDTDALIALFNPTDSNHEKAEKLFQTLLENKARLIYPATTMVETIDTIQRKIKSRIIAMQIVKLIEGALQDSIEPVTADELIHAAMLFKKDTNNQVTIADALVATIAKKHHADHIFSFDKWYSKQGFTLYKE